MPRDRTITGFGPTVITLTHSSTLTTGTPWRTFGPFDAGKFYAAATFSYTSAGSKVKVRALISTSSTASVKTIWTQTGNNSGAYKKSTYTSGVFSFIQVFSSAGPGAATSASPVTKAVYFNALP